MLTSLTTLLRADDDREQRDDRAPYRPYRVVVARIQDLSPRFRRVTFVGDQLRFFAPHGLDQRIKVVFPHRRTSGGEAFADIGVDDERALLEGSWYSRWRALPSDQRNPFRTYTVRAVRPDVHELDIDFVLHPGGIAGQWLTSVMPGDEVLVVGPDVRSLSSTVGIDWKPGAARDVLLLGDETAAPAICSIVESLGAGIRATAFIEVSDGADELDVSVPADSSIIWMPRSQPSGTLELAVRAWAQDLAVPGRAERPRRAETADVAPYAWVAGESSRVKILRRLLVSDLGLDRRRVVFTGYWRRGAAEMQE